MEGIKLVRLQTTAHSFLLLTYLPSGVSEEGWHEIDVKLKKGKGDIRARCGYCYETNQRQQ